MRPSSGRTNHWRKQAVCLLLWLGFGLAADGAAAKAKITISKAIWKGSALTVSGRFTKGAAGTPVELYDLSGRLLGTGGLDDRHKFSFPALAAERPELLCGVRVKVGELSTIKPVKGAGKDCNRVPACQITAPAGGTNLTVGQETDFTATAKLKDKKAGPLKYEWDFAGGAMGHPTELAAKASFVRNNSRYRVRFSATDAKGRRCEDLIEVTVGTLPAAPEKVAGLAQKAQQDAPKLGNQLDGSKGKVVVLPADEWSYQCINDHYIQPNIETVYPWPVNSLQAVAYKKDRQPPVLDGSQVQLRYLAASNPNDPVGADSINSTSQNYPVGERIRKAEIAKSDFWETVDRTGQESTLADDYVSRYWAWQYTGGSFGYPKTSPVPDEGLPKEDMNPGHGRYMPGILKPYEANDPQDFSRFDTGKNQFAASFIPVMDVDDQGRVNPYPLMRVQAVDKESKEVLAATDVVMTAGRDLHCRECHAKGQVAADPGAPWSEEAYHSSLNGTSCGDLPADAYYRNCTTIPYGKPEFVEAKDATYQEQEWAALQNIALVHDFYDWAGVQLNDAAGLDANGKRHDDGSFACDGCHISPLRNWPASTDGQPFELWGDYFAFEKYGKDTTIYTARGESNAVHGLHSRFMKNPDGSLQREANGKPKLWNPEQGRNKDTLFPVVAEDGSSLPMEQNCLRCHSGQREQCYRDRMYTAGTTCFDCHGDVSAIGLNHKKPEALKTADGNNYRVAWYEQPDCGSCHTGNANEGADKGNGFFSAGVKRRAFADDDLSATPLRPKTDRFAVLPVTAKEWPQEDPSEDWSRSYMTLTTALFRDGKDTHGNVPCSACHGAAHAVWPNRDPNANDNVTSLQLQGHTGTVLKCNVCHTADSFKELADLDGGKYMTDLADRTDFHGGSGVLGGPHYMHPVNDPNWWKQAKDNTEPDDTGTSGTAGGWHNDLAKQPGKHGEDQCAACHGNDHKGTRLSKTPVDRVFDFSGPEFDWPTLTKAGFKKKVIKVAAGSFIGCDTCHDIKTSCIDSPAGQDKCGKPSTDVPEASNTAPVIDSTPVSTGVIGQPYSYQVHATDADGDALAYGIDTPHLGGLSVTATGKVTITWDAADFAGQAAPLSSSYTVSVIDSRGAFAKQAVTVNLGCPTNLSWDKDLGHCMGPGVVLIT
ncbi:MAG: cytochrome C [Methylococcaceae bacterium]|nr:cytochrome C [Methylococcaceae bacterium]